MSNPKIAIILYTVREPAAEDLVGTLKRVRAIGFEYVQWSGMPALPADQIRRALDKADLEAIACHCAVEPFEENFDEEATFWKTVGVAHVAPGGMMNDCREPLDAWVRGARRLDALGAKLRAAGLQLSYHNHDFELGAFEDDPRPKLDILYEETAPENLCAELDLAWVYAGGADPVAYVRKYAQRCPLIHVKDLRAERKEGRVQFAELGRGVLDWPAIFDAARESGVEWCIYEQDQDFSTGDPLDSAQVSYAFLKEHLG
ncbi:MAG TPA: sugar phosphate isomerase/epimerase [Candidatus Hydrogenedentes bacterium]|nr:sugar phosphate isomerase/epimerase [Candidatus Hydrogenedentota bacterium]HIJ73846.1 sugar phosphate isomerase/epimerase [Candidatus Hydrogenedentota bacterium]